MNLISSRRTALASATNAIVAEAKNRIKSRFYEVKI